MNEKTYTPQQMAQAERLILAVASVPEDKRPAYIRIIEAMMLGAELADLARSKATA